MTDFVRSALLLLVILNPFALSVYLIEMFRERSLAECARIVTRAVLISGAVFVVFVWTGETIFRQVLQIHFASFQIFGGALFFVIALRFMLDGQHTLVSLRGEPGHVAGAIAMPFMIGPGTVSAATLAGLRLGPMIGTLAVLAALVSAAVALVLLKYAFDHVHRRNSGLVERYIEIASRVTAMVIGSFAVDMALRGFEAWWK